MYRLFVAIDLPEDVKEGLAWMTGGMPGARWIAEEDFHLTLRFIGEVDGGVFDDLSNAFESIREEGFELQLKGLGHFPPRREPKVLWAGVEPSPQLQRLRDAVDRICTRYGVERDPRKFHPHVTLARLSGASIGRVTQFLADNAMYRSRTFPVTEFHLYSSTLHPAGATHHREHSYPLITPPELMYAESEPG